MKKIILFSSFIIFAVIIAVIIRIQIYPFGYKAPEISPGTQRLDNYISATLPNTSIYSYKINVKINDVEDFVDYLKSKADTRKPGEFLDLNEYELGSFMNSDGEVNWQKVQDSVEVKRLLWRKVYALSYRTLDPECNGYRLEITSDGYILDYRSAGI